MKYVQKKTADDNMIVTTHPRRIFTHSRKVNEIFVPAKKEEKKER